MIYMNDNTSPRDPFTDEQILEVIKNTDINKYPEGEYDNFRNLYGDYYDIDPANISLSNGSDEYIQKLIIQFGQDGILTINPDFTMYEVYANQFSRDFWQVDSDEDFNFDLKEVFQAIEEKRPSLLIISSPQNPTGIQFSQDQLQALADTMEDIGGWFAIDETYVEFGQDYKRPENENVIILRSLSKICGVAGLRLGMAISKGKTYERMTAINHPYPINKITLNLASELFKNTEQLEAFLEEQKESKVMLDQAFSQVKDLINIKESNSNFIFTYGDQAVSLGAHLMYQGFRPRTYEEDNLKKCVRYSIIGKDNYQLLNKAILEWRQENDNK